ncbi:MAG: sulfurtransferase-like selenium metabolism protein YedF [Firmicutes bacterium]|nr:sulfurtransferase-like selenium metabolism protein YedF [Bacillota bacterium]
MKNIAIDARADQCPIPVVKAKKALESLDGPGLVEISVGNLTAVENLKRLAASLQREAQVSDLGGGDYLVRIAADAPLTPAEAAAPLPACKPSGGVLAAIGSRTMGQGDDELGAVLMKGFIYALTQLEPAPRTLLFYNGGAWLTVEDSPALADLRELADRGTEILTCGTCLNHYGIKDRLAVGEVTNMYTIVEKLAGADRVIRP